MPEQVSLTKYGAITTAVPQQTKSNRNWNPGGLKARIVVLEPAAYGRCSLCKRIAMLRFCLKYLNSEGTLIMWAPICKDCAGDIQNSQRARLKQR